MRENTEMFNHGGYIHVPVYLYDEVFFKSDGGQVSNVAQIYGIVDVLFVESKVFGRKGPSPAEKNSRITGPDPAAGAKDRPPKNRKRFAGKFALKTVVHILISIHLLCHYIGVAY